MRSSAPMPGNPWPHDMVIRGEDRPHALLELLWVREAYGLDVRVDVPLLRVTPARIETDAATRADWSARWPEVWEAALLHATDADTSAARDALVDAPFGSPERAELFRTIFGPSWRVEIGGDPFGDPSAATTIAFDDDAYRRWSASLPRVERARRLEEHPERRDLEALIPAWRRGLTTWVSLPVVGYLGRRVGAHGLLVSDETRADSEAYRRALASF